jgi:hypothetical protein
MSTPPSGDQVEIRPDASPTTLAPTIDPTTIAVSVTSDSFRTGGRVTASLWTGGGAGHVIPRG